MLYPFQEKTKGVAAMAGVRISEHEPFENALKRFKKLCEREGILSDIRKRQYFEKPSAKRKRKAIAARKRCLRSRAAMR